MKYVNLGSQGLKVSMEGLGCMGMSAFYGPSDEAENLATLARALELGIDFFDTAEIYGPFKNEQLLAKAFKGKRDQVKIATKVGSEVTDEGERKAVNGRPDYIRKAIDRSLKHLGTDHVDLYYLHRIDPNVPIEESVGALADLVAAGKVRYIGVSEASAATIRKAHATHPLTALQTEYSLFERGVEGNEVMDTVRELGIGFVAYSPLGRGLLTGAISSTDTLADTDFRRSDPRWSDQNFDKNMALVGRIRSLAERKGVRPSQLALAWVFAQGALAIPGTRRIKYLEENAAAVDIALDENELAELNDAAPAGAAAGDRYTPAGMQSLNR
ncbi:aldo/keto reductase [Paradevosia shaoguanensis]|uniref:Aldo/keto reductase n=1 Tax=Paradevosia shaoguanensis TaxID=1335043 RepID=A0AA41UCA8_9HYPH|nr:aldo/keto reductase [Paradevosia shaoguanensis]MCF1741621.1 aldo/keto reductase [Paradevosia shaoguanensis]MCI0126104.1 aldo/keto reductase [Paradevosia shaoguanensis]CDP51597.1 Aldo-keto reductase [Devosia sp. DBB001]